MLDRRREGLLVGQGQLRRRVFGREEGAGAEGDDHLLVLCKRGRHRPKRQLREQVLERAGGGGEGSGRGLLSDQASPAIGDKVQGARVGPGLTGGCF